MTAEEIITREERLAVDRVNWESHWQECADFALPRKATVNQTDIIGGAKRTGKIHDGTAVREAERFAAALHGMLMNQGGQWFSLRTQNKVAMESGPVKRWLSDVEDEMYSVINASNFHTEADELCIDLGVFGSSPFFVEEDREKVIRCTAFPVHECYVAESNKGLVDTVYRPFMWSARQAVQQWGADGVGEGIRKASEKEPDKRFKFLHAVFPRVERDTRAINNLNMPFASLYVSCEDKKIISESGFPEFPYQFPRWRKGTGEVNGRSPTMVALADVKTINAMSRTNTRAGEKLADPPLMVPSEGFMLPIRTNPGGINFYDPKIQARIDPLISGSNVPISIQLEERRELAIKQAYFSDLLSLPIQPNMTATEVMKRIQDQARVLGPMFGRLFSEFLDPLIDRIFGILLRAGRLPRIPREVQGNVIYVEFVSPIAKAMRMGEAQSATHVIEFTAPYVQARPELLDNIDGDEMFRDVCDIAGMPAKWIRDRDAVDELRSVRNRAMEEEAAKAEMMQQAQGAAALSKGLAPFIRPEKAAA